jgi:uncharacterized protein (TIGR00299 family) protein
MTVAALLHVNPDQATVQHLQNVMQSMGLGEVSIETTTTQSHGITALRFIVTSTSPTHPHRPWRDIRKLLEKADLSAEARKRSIDIFLSLAKAEAEIHSTTPEEVIFHEVGAVDSIADVVGCSLAIEALNPDTITSSPPVLGRGVTRSHHGTIPVPAPATLELLKGIPTRGLEVEAELTTPTGAAILAAQVGSFTSWPDLKIQGIGYGAGSRTIEDRPNLLRVVFGEAQEHRRDEILVAANIDDMNPEFFEYLMDLLLGAGAHDVWMQPVIMKKSRPAVTLSMLCDEDSLEKLEGILLRESTTIGVRRIPVSRRKLARRRELVTTPFGEVRLKVSGEGDQVWTVSPEYDDCRSLAAKCKVPVKEVYQAALAAWKSKG